MLKTVISNRGLIPLSLALAASAGLLTAAPAQAGPLDFLKKEVTKTAKKEAKRAVERQASGVRVAVGDVTSDSTARSQDGGGGIFNNGGSANRFDDTDIVHTTTEEKGLSQNGTTVATANEVQAPQTEGQPASAQVGSGRTRARASIEAASATRGKLSQNGTTVATANEVQAPQTEGQAALLLPAVQKAREAAAR